MRSWISSWHICMSSFLAGRPEDKDEWPVLLIIYIYKGSWELEIAKYMLDTHDVRVALRVSIGDTHSLRGTS